MTDLDLIISSMSEYIEILASIALKKNSLDDINELDILNERIQNATTYEEINILKEQLQRIDYKLNTEERQLTSREEALVQRGYDREEVLKLSSFTSKDVEEKKDLIINRITKGCKKVENPICIYIGGQPGCGKSTASRKIRSNNNENGLVDVSLDNYRSYHPNYLEIEECIRKHWEGRTETDNDTKGNDIADFTHNFAGLMSDKVLDDLADQKYNIVLEWGMRTPEIPIQRMGDMKSKGYTNIVDFILVHQDISREACKIRANIMNNFNHIIRRVPNYFHDMCISTLPDSAKQIYEIACKQNNNIDQFMLTDRANRIIWDHTHTEDIKQVFEEYLNNPDLSKEFATNHEDLAVNSYNEEKKGFSNELEEMLQKEPIEEQNEHKEK